MKRSHLLQLLFYSILIAYAILTLFPFAWALSASFKPLNEIVRGGMHLIPQN
ncbi:MAG: carbohydrate ABC transporter permease, partial [Desertifilum sp. SIO1I2]|nr:carbohydrate ABC transporter permease [Desertifilum sp. SIO1I2]